MEVDRNTLGDNRQRREEERRDEEGISVRDGEGQGGRGGGKRETLG